jgi:excisionase family DNA binding protein
MSRSKDVLTTGEVARICNVAPRTVSKWFDSGQLRGYRIPGSKDRRIPVQQLVRFMRAHGMPLDRLESGSYRVLVVSGSRDLTSSLESALTEEAGYEVRLAAGAFEAGVAAEGFRPHILLVDVSLGTDVVKEIGRNIRQTPDLQGTRLVVLHDGLGEQELHALSLEGYDNHLARPFEMTALVQVIEDALAIAY